ncbi:EamA family transporter [Rhodocytophaga aerolata]|uniref:EamA family transporter n=1 Tax=Rhodocytophaga aerolata TaxID=455078 RepID=A0ABT8RAI9_9BACT|nr:EamA family transporter [Rhodocytophaga aerolata]MDO1447777.1 EamA family transporter [Rhodocytophaga aerolata]
MHWLTLLIITAVFFGFYNFFIKVSAGHIHEILGAVILQAIALLLGGIALVYLKLKQVPFENSGKGLLFAVLAGVFVGLAEITSFYAFSKGTPASVGIPVIVGGTVIVGTLLGVIFLKEQLHCQHYAGIVLILTGIYILASR